MGKTIKEQRQERAFKIAQIAAQIINGGPIQLKPEEAVNRANDLLCKAETLVAQERGEFR